MKFRAVLKNNSCQWIEQTTSDLYDDIQEHHLENYYSLHDVRGFRVYLKQRNETASFMVYELENGEFVLSRIFMQFMLRLGGVEVESEKDKLIRICKKLEKYDLYFTPKRLIGRWRGEMDWDGQYLIGVE
jgi:hypothetical protein